MARGWESKSIEEQQAEATSRSDRPAKHLTPQQQAMSRQADGLKLARKNVLQQLQTSTHPRHRQMLEQSLAELDRQIQKLETS